MHKIKLFNKLVRDKIPAIIRRQGEMPTTKILTDQAYSNALKEKLSEEVLEFQDSESLEELADILEVVYAIASQLGSNQQELEEIRLTKRSARGGFEEKIATVQV